MCNYLTAKKLLELLFVGARIEGARFFSPEIQLLISSNFDTHKIGHNGQGVINLTSPWGVFSAHPDPRPTQQSYLEVAQELDLLKFVIGKEIEDFTTFPDSQDLIIHLEDNLEIILTADPQLFEPWYAAICYDETMDCELIAEKQRFSIGAPDEVWRLLGLEPPQPPTRNP